MARAWQRRACHVTHYTQQRGKKRQNGIYLSGTQSGSKIHSFLSLCLHTTGVILHTSYYFGVPQVSSLTSFTVQPLFPQRGSAPLLQTQPSTPMVLPLTCSPPASSPKPSSTLQPAASPSPPSPQDRVALCSAGPQTSCVPSRLSGLFPLPCGLGRDRRGTDTANQGL